MRTFPTGELALSPTGDIEATTDAGTAERGVVCEVCECECACDCDCACACVRGSVGDWFCACECACADVDDDVAVDAAVGVVMDGKLIGAGRASANSLRCDCTV